jgi:hypothetical protein
VEVLVAAAWLTPRREAAKKDRMEENADMCEKATPAARPRSVWMWIGKVIWYGLCLLLSVGSYALTRLPESTGKSGYLLMAVVGLWMAYWIDKNVD